MGYIEEGGQSREQNPQNDGHENRSEGVAAQPPAKRGTTRMPNKRAARSALGFQPPSRHSPSTTRQRPLPKSVDEETIRTFGCRS